jgi:hypothetical protein
MGKHGGHNSGQGRGINWLKAHVEHDGDDCLIWPFYRKPEGYGTLGHLGKVRRAHNLMCELARGPAPTPRHQAAHSCGNGHLGCVHPKHLSWKTCRENRIDSNNHGTGAALKTRRLTLDRVERIKLLKGQKSLYELSEEFGVRPDTICKIWRGETWAKPRSTLTLEQIRLIREAPETDCLKVGKSLGVNSMKVRKLRAGITFQGVE